MKFKHETLIFLSGLLWLSIGGFLLSTGLHLIIQAINDPSLGPFPIIDNFSGVAGGAGSVGIVLIAIGLFIGYAKGRFVLGKSAQRIVRRIRSFPTPMNIVNLYSPAYYLLIGSMMFLGMGIKFFGVPLDIRGTVDVAIGAALINGALIFFRMALSVRNSQIETS